MAIVIPIYFDYASTLCYIAWRIVRELEPELGFEALWKGVPISLRDLRSRGGLGLEPLERQKITMVAAETAIPVTPPNRWLDSRAALEGAELAREAGAFAAYHEAVFRAAFEQRIDIGRDELLGDLAVQAGLDRQAFLADLRGGRMAARVAENKS